MGEIAFQIFWILLIAGLALGPLTLRPLTFSKSAQSSRALGDDFAAHNVPPNWSVCLSFSRHRVLTVLCFNSVRSWLA